MSYEEKFETLNEYFSAGDLLDALASYFGTWKMEDALDAIAKDWDIDFGEEEE